MDLGVGALTATYLPQQGYSQPGGVSARPVSSVAPDNATNGAQYALSGTTGVAVQADGAGTPNAQSTEKQAQDARKKDPAAEITAQPGYTFEVDQRNNKIMKVSDSKGVLIYQVPSKGQLALVEAQDAAQKRLQLTA
jgi:hypothetical protein